MDHNARRVLVIGWSGAQRPSITLK
jgi:hypothetical protein